MKKKQQLRAPIASISTSVESLVFADIKDI